MTNHINAGFYAANLGSLIGDNCNNYYEGTGINDTTYGQMYTLKRYEEAAKKLYDTLRATITVPDDLDKRCIIDNDKRFSVQAEKRSGSSKLDKDLLRGMIANLLHESAPDKFPTLTKAGIEVQNVIASCTTYGKDVTVISIIEDRRDD